MKVQTKTDAVTGTTNVPSDLETEIHPTDQELQRLGDEWWDIGPGVRSLTPEEVDLLVDDLDDGEGNSWW